jgi:hypothetical protein
MNDTKDKDSRKREVNKKWRLVMKEITRTNLNE